MRRFRKPPSTSRRSLPVLVAALVLAPGCGGADTTTTAPPDRDARQEPGAQERGWEARRGDAWDSYVDAFADGWDAGCANTVRLGGGTSLSSDEGTVDVTACVAAKRTPTAEDAPTELPDDPAAYGREDGELFACEAVFDQLALDIGSDGTLASGGQEFSRSNCPAAGNGVAPTQAVPAATTPEAAAGRIVDCPPFDLDGTVGAAGFGFSDVSARNLSCPEVTEILSAQIADASFEDAVLPGGMACERTASTDAPARRAPKDDDADAPTTATPAREAVTETTSYRCASDDARPPTAIRFTLG